MMQYHRQINETGKKKKKQLENTWNTKHKTRSLQSGSLSQVFQKFGTHWMYISYTVTQSFHTRSPVWPHTQSAGGEKKFGRFSSLCLSQAALGVWLLPCQCFPPLRALRAFHLTKVQGQPLLSSPSPFFLTSMHIHMLDFHFSYSVRLAAPPPQGWLKTEGQTSSSVGGMHAGETIPEDLFEAAADSVDESSKRSCGCLGWAVLWSVNLLSTWWPHKGRALH